MNGAETGSRRGEAGRAAAMNSAEQTVTWLITLGVLESPKKTISDPEGFLQASLKDGVVLCRLLERLLPGTIEKVSAAPARGPSADAPGELGARPGGLRPVLRQPRPGMRGVAGAGTGGRAGRGARGAEEPTRLLCARTRERGARWRRGDRRRELGAPLCAARAGEGAWGAFEGSERGGRGEGERPARRHCALRWSRPPP